MPIGAAKRLVGKMAHPLNRPRLRSAVRARRAGSRRPPAARNAFAAHRPGRSLFQRVFSGPNGLDPYAFAVSDVYQDLFEEGSYCGKGIYDVDAFEAALEGQIPEERCSATICWKASSRAPAWHPTSRSSRSFRRATTSPPPASIAGYAEIGSCSPGFSAFGPKVPRRSRENADPAGRPLEDARQSAPLAFGARGAARDADRLAAADAPRPRSGPLTSF